MVLKIEFDKTSSALRLNDDVILENTSAHTLNHRLIIAEGSSQRR